MAKVLKCKDIGFDCDAVVRADSEPGGSRASQEAKRTRPHFNGRGLSDS